MWALPILTQVPCAAPFDPTQAAVLNTVTVFGPRDDLLDFPFDLALTSRIYGWYTLLSLRSSYQNMLRGHLYPTTIAQLPWSDALAARASDLENIRERFFTACRRRFEAEAELKGQANELALEPLRQVFRRLAPAGTALEYSEHFDTGEDFTLGAFHLAEDEDAEGPSILTISDEGHSITLPTNELAQLIRAGLQLVEGQEISKAALLRVPVPPTDEIATDLAELLASFEPDALDAAVFECVDELDAIVGSALGLDEDDIAFIQEELRSDPFLSRIRPRYPYFTPALRGRRLNLERSQRYGEAAEAA
jgi:hypothetical protein